jgi:uncharacterized oligopeptide transporter (OPT) family protein
MSGVMYQPQRPMSQLTSYPDVFLAVLETVLTDANPYLGFFAGMTRLCHSIRSDSLAMQPARSGGILHINIVQTGASAGTRLSSGVTVSKGVGPPARSILPVPQSRGGD